MEITVIIEAHQVVLSIQLSPCPISTSFCLHHVLFLKGRGEQEVNIQVDAISSSTELDTLSLIFTTSWCCVCGLSFLTPQMKALDSSTPESLLACSHLQTHDHFCPASELWESIEVWPVRYLCALTAN